MERKEIGGSGYILLTVSQVEVRNRRLSRTPSTKFHVGAKQEVESPAVYVKREGRRMGLPVGGGKFFS